MNYNVYPDIAVFGKALGNGFAIAAVLGRRSVMEAAQTSFISSLYWTERTGFAAALATLKKMEKTSAQARLVKIGEYIGEGWKQVAAKHNLPITVSGIPPLVHIDFGVGAPLEAQTVYAQEMLAKGYLVASSVYVSTAYTDEIVRKFIEDSEPVFGAIARAAANGTLTSLLKGEAAYAGFKRLA
jgi:glutamate-1-semialdehyde 2,1-aminomutase